VTTLSLSGNQGEAGLQALADAAPCPRLQRLDLGYLVLPNALARAPLLGTLHTLHARGTAEAIQALGHSPYPVNLRNLYLQARTLDDNGFLALCESVALAGLRRLRLGSEWSGPDSSGCPLTLGPHAVAALGRARFAQCLRVLTLNGLSLGRLGNHHAATYPQMRLSFGSAALIALAGSGAYANLERLDLPRCGVGDEGVVALCAAPQLERLEWLNFLDNRMGPVGVRALVAWPGLARLRYLRIIAEPRHLLASQLGPDTVDLHVRLASFDAPIRTFETIELPACNLGDEGIARLISHLPPSRCRRLVLWQNRISGAGARLLAGCRALDHLEELVLSRNPIGDEGALALAGSPHLAGLKKLSLFDCRLRDAALRALVDSPYLKGLQELSLSPTYSGMQEVLAAHFRDKVYFH
jgi:hypothetical protein